MDDQSFSAINVDGMDFFSQLAQLEERRLNPGDSVLDPLCQPMKADQKFLVDIDSGFIPKQPDTTSQNSFGVLLLWCIVVFFGLVAFVVVFFPENDVVSSSDVDPLKSEKFKRYQARKRAELSTMSLMPSC
jgi:hypothetical protein